MIYIEKYNDIIDVNINNVEEIVIDWLYSPLNNIPSSVTKIIIKHACDVLKNQHKIPFDCNLNIDGYKLTEESLDVISKLSNITYLNLCWCGLESLPIEINSLTKLKYIHLGKNYISYNDKSLDELKKRGVEIELRY